MAKKMLFNASELTALIMGIEGGEWPPLMTGNVEKLRQRLHKLLLKADPLYYATMKGNGVITGLLQITLLRSKKARRAATSKAPPPEK